MWQSLSGCESEILTGEAWEKRMWMFFRGFFFFWLKGDYSCWLCEFSHWRSLSSALSADVLVLLIVNVNAFFTWKGLCVCWCACFHCMPVTEKVLFFPLWGTKISHPWACEKPQVTHLFVECSHGVFCHVGFCFLERQNGSLPQIRFNDIDKNIRGMFAQIQTRLT